VVKLIPVRIPSFHFGVWCFYSSLFQEFFYVFRFNGRKYFSQFSLRSFLRLAFFFEKVLQLSYLYLSRFSSLHLEPQAENTPSLPLKINICIHRHTEVCFPQYLRLNAQFRVTIYFHLTSSCLFIQVSYEEFKLQFAQMYEHYEKHRTDNITDPELRQSRPISTISGWDQEREEINLHQTQQIQQSQQVQTVPTDEFNGNEKDDEEQQQPTQQKAIESIPQQKPTISSISDVYHKEISGEAVALAPPPPPPEESEHSVPIDSGNSKLKEILEQQLGENTEEESREIATELVEEILQKSEKLLDECQQDLLNQQETAVIKDEELEQAVHEVVSGVRQIQLKAEVEEDVSKQEQQHPLPTSENDAVEDEQQQQQQHKTEDTETQTQTSAIINDRKQSIAGTDEQEEEEGKQIETENQDDAITAAADAVVVVEDETENKKDDDAATAATIDESKEQEEEKEKQITTDQSTIAVVVDDEAIVESVVSEIIDESVNKVEINSAEELVSAPADAAAPSEQKIAVEDEKKDATEETNEKKEEEEVKREVSEEQVVKEVINDIIEDAVREVEEQEQASPMEDDKATEIDVANNNTIATTPEPETKIHFSASNDSALPSSLSDDSPINENKTNNSTPSSSNEQNLIQEHSQQMNDEGHEPHKQQRQKSTSNRPMFSPGPTRPPFRIPEFKWSYIHQRLLSDVLFSLETDIQVWRSHSTKSVLDFVNSAENAIFVVNTVHLISQLADNLIIACGGLLPLLASATSPNSELDVLEPTQGMPLDVAVSFLQRLVNMADVLVFASSLNFGELEAEKNMSSGGILRQCLRLVSTCAVRNCLECKERTRGMYNGGMREIPGAAHLQALIRGAQTSPKSIVDTLTGPLSPVKDPEKLLQDMDVNRLRAVIYRDVVSF
jgi:hypothetical protein